MAGQAVVFAREGYQTDAASYTKTMSKNLQRARLPASIKIDVVTFARRQVKGWHQLLDSRLESTAIMGASGLAASVIRHWEHLTAEERGLLADALERLEAVAYRPIGVDLDEATRLDANKARALMALEVIVKELPAQPVDNSLLFALRADIERKLRQTRQMN